MTIKRMIQLLEEIAKKEGDIEVFFDCPTCEKSFTPDKMVKKAIHLERKV